MKLSGIEIHGFKSFADRTKLRFEEGITGIVGPNGCGKSNVIDAIRWVLGEQKTRNLRSDKMENVIFNGTDKRKKASLAEVSLTLENTRNLLPTEYSTVTITRRLFRDGDSEYLLNNIPCRLKDINNLLLDTGIGSDSYSIIELSMVEDILTDKNNSRRTLFEEAAGISKYKLRKKETMHKLEESEQSLTRVEDLLYEIEKNLKSLEKQAKRAEKYLEVKAQYKLASIQLALLRMRALEAQQVGMKDEEARLNQLLAENQARIATAEARHQELQIAIAKQEELLHDAQREYNAYMEGIQKLEAQKALSDQRVRYLLERKEVIAAQLETEGQQRDSSTTRIGELKQALTDTEAAIATQEQVLAQVAAQLEAAKAAAQAGTQAVEEARGQMRSREEVLNSHQRDAERRQIQAQGLHNELQRGSTDRQGREAEIAQLKEKTQRIKDQLARLEADQTQLNDAKQANENALKDTNEKLNALKERSYEVRRALDARQQEYNIAKGLVESLEGYSESVKFLRKHAQWRAEVPLLSEIFYIPEEAKVAVEWLLEPYMNYFVVGSRAEAALGSRILKLAGKGRAHFFILEEFAQAVTSAAPAPQLAGVQLQAIGDYVTCDAQYKALVQALLDGVWVAAGELNAEASLPEGVTVVEKAGALLVRKQSVSGGSVGLFEGKRIGRAKDLEKLGPEIAALQAQLQQLEQENQQQQAMLKQLLTQNPSERLEAVQREVQLLHRQLAVQQVKEEEYENFISRIASRGADIEAELQRIQQDSHQAAPQLDSLQAEVLAVQEQLNQRQHSLQQLSDNLAVLNAQYNAENIKLIGLQNQLGSLHKDLQFQQDQLENIARGAAEKRSELGQITEEVEGLSVRGSQDGEEIIRRYETRRQLADKLAAEEEQLRSIKHSSQQQEDSLRTERHNKEDIAQQFAALRDRGTEIRIQQNSLQERMSVEFQLDIFEVSAERIFEKAIEEYSLGEVEAQMLHLRDQVQKFGEVNPTAIEAYREIRERYDFIQAQRKDLQEAKENLLTTLNELDSTAREKFMAAFDEIRDNFGRVFRTLFTDQDTCDLLLVRPDDPLESPIEIIAKPKGKRPLTINQLSGGEKTLTAISLLFSIYLLKPAPFCIFDEVDAPLDDANIDKFTRIVSEFSAQSQFIIVTHNKRTMVTSQVMYGVTMEETGVSRVLPVDLVALNLN